MNTTDKQPTHDHQLRSTLSKIFCLENVLAFVLAIILITIYIVTAADAPLWVYQGF